MTHPNENEARTYRWNGVPYEEMSQSDLLEALTEATRIAADVNAFMASMKKRADEAEAELARVRKENRSLRHAVEVGIVTLDRGKKQSAAMAEMYQSLGFQSDYVESSRPFNFAEETVEEAKAEWLSRSLPTPPERE